MTDSFLKKQPDSSATKLGFWESLGTSKLFCGIYVICTSLSIFNGFLFLGLFGVFSLFFSGKLALKDSPAANYVMMRDFLRANGLNALQFLALSIVLGVVTLIFMSSNALSPFSGFLNVAIGILICLFISCQLWNIWRIVKGIPEPIVLGSVLFKPFGIIIDFIKTTFSSARTK